MALAVVVQGSLEQGMLTGEHQPIQNASSYWERGNGQRGSPGMVQLRDEKTGHPRARSEPVSYSPFVKSAKAS